MKDLRAEFLAEQVELKNKRLFFLDESGFRLGSCSRYGWSQKGEKAYGSETCGSWQTITMLGAMNADNICSFMTIDSGTTLDVFNVFIDTQLIKHLKKGDCVIMDNIASHKNGTIIKKIEATGAEVKFLPPYSPDLNPIEKLWSKLKESLRRLNTITREMLEEAIAKALTYISTDDLQAWIKHCGYEITSY